MANQRTIEGAELRDRIDQYLRESGLAGNGAKVVPRTGDASDRRYFRILPPDGPSVVLALHAGPIEFATLPFANVADLLQQIPLPVPVVLGHSDTLGILALQDLGDVTLQAHLGAASPAEHAALYRQAVALVEQLQRRGAELTDQRYLPYRIAFELEELIAYFLALKGIGDAEEFRRRFDLMALQRNLKALGTFGYQTLTRQNSVYIQYMPRTLRYARTNLEKYALFDRLRAILGQH